MSLPSKAGPKWRRTERACLACRQKKKRCDGAQMAQNECSYCIANGFQCTFVEVGEETAPPERLSYVKALEWRLAKLEELIEKNDGTGNALANAMARKAEGNSREQRPDEGEKTNKGCGVPPGESLEEHLSRLRDNPSFIRFRGESSAKHLIETAVDIQNREPAFGKSRMQKNESNASRRPEFWNPPSWPMQIFRDIDRPSDAPCYDFPPEDLISMLVDSYFENLNAYWPVLHRPTFDEWLACGFHFHHLGFATIVILVCANGAQFCEDPRVCFEPGMRSSAGWGWFNQVDLSHTSLYALPSLFGVQSYCLAVIFLRYTSLVHIAWRLTGIGIRMAQDIGAHRREAYGDKPSAHDEQWKRAFWILVGFDGYLSAVLGRQCAIQYQDFDLDLATECDDEYWENADPELAFAQPPEKPSLICYFNRTAKLHTILASALRGLYSIKKANSSPIPASQPSKQQIVAELDSALNEWQDSLPAHLVWEPEDCDNEVFYKQSAMMHAFFHSIRIIIHRSFIPVPRKQPSVLMPSLSICTHAATSCAHILDKQLRRHGIPLLHLVKSAFSMGVVLLLSIWGSKRSGMAIDPVKQMSDAAKCLKFLTACESKMWMAGRMADLFRELASLGEIIAPSTGDGPPTRLLALSPTLPAAADAAPRQPVSDSKSASADPAAAAAVPKDAADWATICGITCGDHPVGHLNTRIMRAVPASPSGGPYALSNGGLRAPPSGLARAFISAVTDAFPIPPIENCATTTGAPDADPAPAPAPASPPESTHSIDPFKMWAAVPWSDDPDDWSAYIDSMNSGNFGGARTGMEDLLENFEGQGGTDAGWNGFGSSRK